MRQQNWPVICLDKWYHSHLVNIK